MFRRLLRLLVSRNGIIAPELSDDGTVLAFAANEKTIHVFRWDGSSEWTRRGADIVFGDNKNNISDVSMSGDGCRIAMGDIFYDGERGKARVVIDPMC